MKKIFYLAAMTLVSFAATMSFTSCDDDNNDKPASKVVNASVTVTYNVSPDILKFFDVSIIVKDFIGKTDTINLAQSDSIGKAVSKTFSTSSQNCELSLSYMFAKRNDVTPTAGTYTFTKCCSYYTTYTKNTSDTPVVSKTYQLGDDYPTNKLTFVTDSEAKSAINEIARVYSEASVLKFYLTDGVFSGE